MATLNPHLKSFWLDDNGKLTRARNRVLYGGRASSKSWEFAGRAAHIGQEFKTRFLCVRRYQNKIKDSVYTLIKNQISSFGLTGYNVMASEIKHLNGSEFAFYGIERNTDEIKSFEGADVLWIEEAHNLTAEQWAILEPTIRKEGSEIWISFNPDLITDFIYQRFIVNPPESTVSRLINYIENPFLSSTLLKVIEQMKEQDYDQYQHVYLGTPRSNDDEAIIKRTWVESAVDAHLTLGLDITGAITVGYDVADSGADKNAIAKFNGGVCEYIEEWKAEEDELTKSTMRAYSFVAGGKFIYDSIGVGAGVGSILREGGINSFSKFNAGDAVFKPNKEYAPKITNKDKFENLKAQAWRDVADRLRNTFNAVNKGMVYNPSELISISSSIKDIEALKTELCSPHKDYSKRGLDMVESKKDLAKRGIASPNKADAFIMGACPHLVKTPVRII
jgi:phage terminase large subunit